MLGLASLSARSTQHALRFSAQTASMSSLSWVKKRAAPIRAPPGQHVAWLSAKAGDEAWHLRDTEEKVIMMAKGLVSYYDRTESNRASDRDQMLDECIDSLSAFRHTVNLNTRLQTMFTSSEVHPPAIPHLRNGLYVRIHLPGTERRGNGAGIPHRARGT